MDGGDAIIEQAAVGTARQDGHAPDQYRSLFENAVEGIYRTTPDGRYLAANPALARIYGYDGPEALVAGLTDIAHLLYVDPADRDRFTHLLEHHSEVRNFEARVRRKDGSVIWIAENARAVRDPAGAVLCYEGTVQDITERKQTEERLRLAAAVFDNVGEAIVVTDGDHVVRAVNSAFERMTGFTAEAVIGLKARILATEVNDPDLVAEAFATAAIGGIWQGELWARRADGDVFPVSAALTGIRGPDGGVQTHVLLCHDVTRRKLDEQKIRYHASHDTLTRLANRHTVMEALRDAIARAARTGQRLALLFLDLNRFKDVNDSFGHGAGDDLLRQVARRLKSCVRASDIIGRLGGDEFVVALPTITDPQGAVACAEKVVYSFSDPFTLAGRELYTSASIGIAVYPDDGDTAEALLSSADAAMYHARASGRPYRYYDQEMNRQAVDRLNLENDIRKALADRQFRLHYQPKVERGGTRIVGAEALIRWRHPERGDVSPAMFIPVAERAGLVGAIGDWALSEACRQMAEWRARGLEFGCVSVNLSPAQFHDAGLKDKVEAALKATGLGADRLELEITETMMATEVDRAIAILSDLGRMGVRVSIDDFGTGYSSLAYLKLFPVNALKIDRAFVSELPGNGKDGAIVASVVALAANLGFEVIAEGVETEAQAAFLIERGVHVMQGFLYSPAVDSETFAGLLAQGF
ncbi:bifunctional diguanylate cyclase/phosphodiesterase [Magnetospirillum sp. UT-4]|uniref:putative bifunctional diguanylate cyclase/phosphodiesterase n=1 Tax=Magnetospirillum sp. UT-4 TaxID=2681467 RepID=UPI001382C911|nr:EAL domain-containing protein [Magnetospirillum sp. UT-4]CAA7626488.1 Diguanylate cyclase/phosphodiesterase [Magnetospirillum sp. UT-4]